MNKARLFGVGLASAVLVAGLSMVPAGKTFAHCDTTSGPIIPEAKGALEKGDVTPVLKWVTKEREGEIRAAFARAASVRAKGPEERNLADQHFLETLVRLHRAGEGAPYTGIKDEPAEPIAAMADKALADGSPDAMIQAISAHMAEAIKEKFKKAVTSKISKDKSIEEGREFVEAYVAYMHHIEAVHSAIVSAGGHHAEAGGAHKD